MKAKLLFLLIVSVFFINHVSYGIASARCAIAYRLHSDTTKLLHDTVEVDFYSGWELNCVFGNIHDYFVEPITSEFGVIRFDKAHNIYAVTVLYGLELDLKSDGVFRTNLLKVNESFSAYDKLSNSYRITVLGDIYSMSKK
jgi:hypothetical protein